MTLQTCAAENFRLCQWGDERTRQACADGERGPPLARVEFDILLSVLLCFYWFGLQSLFNLIDGFSKTLVTFLSVPSGAFN